MFKICAACDTQNDINEPMCKECFQRKFIFNNNEQNDKESKKLNETVIDKQSKVLKLKINDDILVKIENNDTIGREALLKEYLKDNLKISRKHCRFMYDNNSWSIIDENSTNGTYINNIKLKKDEKMILQNKDILKISLSYSMIIIID